jgi:HAD superfamily hydrolase (TIGR01509 family)
MTKLVIFDHDGLMVNSEDVVFAALCELFGRYEKGFPWDYYCQTIGLPVAESIRMYVEDFPVGRTYEEFFAERNRLVGERLITHLRLMPGVVELLDTLRAQGIATAVATSGTRDYIARNLERFDIAHYFAAVVCIEDVRRGKPHPDLILRALEATGTPSEEAIMLEDAPHGVEAAQRAGVYCIAVPTQGIDYSRFQRADLIARDLLAVRRIFER